MPIEHPIVVRLDGTNAEEGRRILAERRREPPPRRRCSTRPAGPWSWRVTDVWSERAELYRERGAARGRGPRPDRRVGDGREHGARRRDRRRPRRPAAARGRARGRHDDPSPGMRPDVICPAEHLPFADAASTSSSAGSPRTTSRTSRAAVPRWRASPARRDRRRHALPGRGGRGGGAPPRPVPRPHLQRGRVARVLRGGRAWPSRRSSRFEKRIELEPGSSALAARATRRARVRELLADRIEDGEHRRLDQIVAEGRKKPDGDHRRPGHEARRPGAHRQRGLLPRPAQRATGRRSSPG